MELIISIIIIILFAFGFYFVLKLFAKAESKDTKLNPPRATKESLLKPYLKQKSELKSSPEPKSDSRPKIDLSDVLSQPYPKQSSDELNSVKKRLRMLLYGDDDAIKRIIQSERRQSPHKSEVELYKNAIERLERDRGR
ncbi:MAG: hypothetical protein AAGA80_13345 [Cyanobacteria bacterium P01_F01_bin.143]